MILHAGLIARRIGGQWHGVLIEGPPGAGKSDLALRAIEAGFALVADDRVSVFVSAGRLYGRAPGPLAGLIEVRGVGVSRRGHLPLARISLRAACVGGVDMIERMPENPSSLVHGLSIPTVLVWPFEPSASAKLTTALEQLGAGAQQGYLARFVPPDGRDGA
jgi:serine kinase of HPr protein (carbohydrate metabolism regulator)